MLVLEDLLRIASDDAREKMEDWRRSYNEERPHGAIGQKAPVTLLNPDDASGPPS
jgi:putative transposase